MSRAPKEKASESRKIHIPIFPGVALPYWASGGQATAGWPCCEATVVLKRHLPLRARRLPRRRGFRYLIATGPRDARRNPSALSRSPPRRSERRGRPPAHLDSAGRAHRRVANRLGAAHAAPAPPASPRDGPAVRAHRTGRRSLRLEGPRGARVGGELHLHEMRDGLSSDHAANGPDPGAHAEPRARLPPRLDQRGPRVRRSCPARRLRARAPGQPEDVDLPHRIGGDGAPHRGARAGGRHGRGCEASGGEGHLARHPPGVGGRRRPDPRLLRFGRGRRGRARRARRCPAGEPRMNAGDPSGARLLSGSYFSIGPPRPRTTSGSCLGEPATFTLVSAFQPIIPKRRTHGSYPSAASPPSAIDSMCPEWQTSRMGSPATGSCSRLAGWKSTSRGTLSAPGTWPFSKSPR